MKYTQSKGKNEMHPALAGLAILALMVITSILQSLNF